MTAFSLAVQADVRKRMSPPNELDELPKTAKLRIKLGDGKERSIQHMLVASFWYPDGTTYEFSTVPVIALWQIARIREG